MCNHCQIYARKYYFENLRHNETEHYDIGYRISGKLRHMMG